MNILVVDDKQSVLDLLSNILVPVGYCVQTACNGLDAFEKAQQQNFDLFIVDHLMPVMNGVQLTKNLKQHQPTSSTPVVFMTTQGIESAKNLPEYSLFDAVIAKPINEDLLINVITTLSQQQVQTFTDKNLVNR
jgi:CheY-like chemotaxis protein